MNKILTIAALALIGVLLLPGCTATKIEYEQNNKGETKYSLWHNDHWMKTSTERLAGGMDKNGKFSVELAGRDSSPSEEFNRTMQTYMNAIVSTMQIAAAAYNPSASGALQNVSANQSAATKSASAATTQQSAAAPAEAAPAEAAPAISEKEASASATNATTSAEGTVK